MYRLACDTDDLAAIVPTPIILTYADLFTSRAQLDALRDRFPTSTIKLIDRGLGDPAAVATAISVSDTEAGARTVADTVLLIRQWVQDGRDFPTAYADRSTMPLIINALAGLHGWWKWWATLDGTMRAPGHPGDMVQFASAAMTGGHYDLSIIYDNAWHPQVGL